VTAGRRDSRKTWPWQGGMDITLDVRLCDLMSRKGLAYLF
jgi:hypothetical protein